MMTPFPMTQDTSSGLTLFKLLQHIGGLKSGTHGIMKSAMGATEEPEGFTTILKKLVAAMGNTSSANMTTGNISGEDSENAEAMVAALSGYGEKNDLSRQCAILSAMLDGKVKGSGDGMKELMSQVFDGKDIKGKDAEKSRSDTRHTARASLTELAKITRSFNDAGNEISPGTTSQKSQMHVADMARHVAGGDKTVQMLKTCEGGENPTGNTLTVEAVPADASSRKSVHVQGMMRDLAAAGNDTKEHGTHDDATRLQASAGTPDKSQGAIRNRQVPVSADSKDTFTSIRDDGVRNVMESAIPPVREKHDRPRLSPKFTDMDMSESRREGDVGKSTQKEGPKTAALPNNMSARDGDRSFAKGEVVTQYGEAVGDEHPLSSFKSDAATSQRFADLTRTARAITRTEGTVQTLPTQSSSVIAGNNGATAAASIRSEALFDKVVQGARQQVLKGGGRMKITLNPPHLGSLNVDVIVQENKVHVMLRAANADVQHLLQANTEQLKASLGTQGLIADTISVSVNEKSGDHSHGYGYNGGLPDEHRNNREQRNNRRDHDAHVQHAVTAESRHTSIDGAISIFA
jgi:flagellar hook-length control protein FliK